MTESLRRHKRGRGRDPRRAPVLTSRAMLRYHVIRAAALAAALAVLAPAAHAQGLRLTRPPAWTPDSVVKAVITGGSAQLMPDPEVDSSVPRIWLTRAERTRWRQTADYDEVMRRSEEHTSELQ